MAESSLESQIDCFLEQFKRNASKAMEERSAVTRSRSSYLDTESPDEPVTPCEEIEMVSTIQTEPLGLNDVAELLHSQYAIISGGKSKEGCPIITFPDNNNFHLLSDVEYQRLMLYLTSVPSLQEADLGFHLIIDRRKDRWNSVKTVLLKISVYFPGLIHVVYVIRPASFLQKALSEVSNKLFKDEFKFRMIVLSTIEELHEYIDLNQITPDLGGSLQYSHEEWMQQRIELEKFSVVTQQVSNALDKFTKIIDEAELPNNVDSTQQILNRQTLGYSELKEEILSAARQGEDLLCSIKRKSANGDGYSCDTMGNVFAIERLLVQLEETERTFDDFWQQHSTKLRHCLELRRFEQDFRELQINFNSHLKVVNEMTEVGESINRIDSLIKELIAFEKLCLVDIERAEEVVSSGQSLIQNKVFYPLQCIEPKCCELITMRDTLVEKLNKRKETLAISKEVIEQIDKANIWCTKGLHLLETHKVDKCYDPETPKMYIREIEEFLKTGDAIFARNPQDFISAEIKTLLAQVSQKIDEVSLMCEKRISTLNMLLVPLHGEVPKQPPGGAPHPNKKKTFKIPKSESSEKHIEEVHQTSPENEEVNKAKTGHVLTELIETEKFYVSELLSVLTGYKLEVKSEEMQHLVTPGLADKINIIFGNLDEIYSFHANIFLQDLENCISSIDLVALCFVQRRDTFFRLYSCYCQNIPRSEQLRETLVDSNMFFQACQRKLGHKLPLAAYLLKPVQRITKYQLLLKDLLRYSEEGKCCRELQQALDCMLVVLKCVNDSMHQISITGFPVDLSQQGDLLLQGSFSIWVENKKDLRLRLKPLRRHVFLYQKSILFCKAASKSSHNKATYQFKHYLKMSQIGLTESVKGDPRKFEIWLQGRQEVYTIQASNIEQKQSWVNEIKRVLLNQLEELKGEKIKQYTAQAHKQFVSRPLRQTTSWEKQKNVPNASLISHRTMSCDTESQAHDENIDIEGENWSSDCTNSDDEEHGNNIAVPSGRYIALADYCAVGNSEVNMREGDMVELLKVGCAGWWFVKIIGSSVEGWAPAAYLENLHRKTSRSSSRSQDKLNDH
nr:PREDICTED: guanine nucleotide exchange factor DBS isoform X1 [Tribolium castaneum]XP_015837728.1 PREDICTED: guanine nucleotide exchange factor DBS isoform X1 [Tribolium castaneum]XP_015837982.1 PREDICTED: guanine nucleotide exchange factor DBS isoform X1 [Tribolium castaneum]|eukprot:XP_015837407.1 PREDICTED: guanine nucleotide exchange factor DBS isoform X1 [Tribolium castaneum]